jgi:hypothetical protein
MLTQAIANLQALLVEILDYVTEDIGAGVQVQCWADKVGTAIADLQEVEKG